MLHRRRATVAAAIAVGLVAAAAFGARRWTSGDPLAELAIAAGDAASFEARFAGGFHPKREGVTRGETVATLSPEARITIAKIEQRASSDGGSRWLNALAVASAVQGDVNRAVSALEDLSRLFPRDPETDTNLAAVYLIRSRTLGRLDDAARALSAARRALDVNPQSREALFNLALGYESILASDEAKKAWLQYVASDSTSEWSRDARRHLDVVTRRAKRDRAEERRQIMTALRSQQSDAARAMARQIPDSISDYIHSSLIPAWAIAVSSGDHAASAVAAVDVRALGTALADVVNDRFAADTAVTIERIGNSSAAALALARAHRSFATAMLLYRQDRFAESASHFRDALETFTRYRSPYRDWSRYLLATEAYYRGDLAAAATDLDSLIDTAQQRQYQALRGKMLRLRGLLHSLRGEIDQSLSDYRAARAAFEQVSDRDELGAIHSVLAQRLEAIGDYQTAWQYRRDALLGLSAAKDPQTILLSTATLAKRQNLLPAALAYLNEALAAATQSDNAVDLVGGLISRADVYHLSGDESRAVADIDEALRQANRIADPGVAKRLRAEAELASGEVAPASPQSLDGLGRSLDYFTAAGMEQRLARVYQAIGRAYQRQGRPGDAQQSFVSGIEILERQRARLASGSPRLGYFDLPWNVFDDMVALLADRPDGALAALMFAERYRARDLAETAQTGSQPSLIDPASLAGALKDGETIIYEAALPDQLLSWVVQRSGVRLFRRQISAPALEAQVSAFRTAIERKLVNEVERRSRDLFDAVIGPFASALVAGTPVVFIPDGPLHALPYAALRSPNGRYLIEDHTIAAAPSATILSRSLARTSALSPLAEETMLVIGNPLLEAADAKALPNLVGAEHEAARIAARHQHAVALTGAEATKTQFVRRAGGFDVVHFAGHAIANESYPLLSRLLFARDEAGESGALLANDVLSMQFERTRLVVLAACRTASGSIKKGEGAIGLARPFLARGVPSVVATLWDIDDHASEVLFEAFYDGRRRGVSTADALRTAQLSMLHHAEASLRNPGAWAGFAVTGGGF